MTDRAGRADYLHPHIQVYSCCEEGVSCSCPKWVCCLLGAGLPPSADTLAPTVATVVAPGGMGWCYGRSGTHLRWVLLLLMWVVCAFSGFPPTPLGGNMVHPSRTMMARTLTMPARFPTPLWPFFLKILARAATPRLLLPLCTATLRWE